MNVDAMIQNLEHKAMNHDECLGHCVASLQKKLAEEQERNAKLEQWQSETLIVIRETDVHASTRRSHRLHEFAQRGPYGTNGRIVRSGTVSDIREARLDEVVAFLMGEGPLEGCWFGEKPETERGNFWWRKHLRAALAASAVPQAPIGEVVDVLKINLEGNSLMKPGKEVRWFVDAPPNGTKLYAAAPQEVK